MEFKSVFKRYELKYLMDTEQTAAVYGALHGHMVPDRFGRSTIRNVYFDTPDFLLARRQISHPVYKEKLRFRSYARPSEDDEVFVELKKKYDSVVYKRRLTMPLLDAEEWFCGNGKGPDTQIGDEIGFMKVRYPGIRPAMFLSYDREAYCAGGCADLRITIDTNILARTDDTVLSSGLRGHPVLPDGYTLMEIKTMYGYPGWLTSLLSSNRLYKSRFTKYGNAYKEIVLGRVPEEYAGIPGGERTVHPSTVSMEGRDVRQDNSPRRSGRTTVLCACPFRQRSFCIPPVRPVHVKRHHIDGPPLIPSAFITLQALECPPNDGGGERRRPDIEEDGGGIIGDPFSYGGVQTDLGEELRLRSAKKKSRPVHSSVKSGCCIGSGVLSTAALLPGMLFQIDFPLRSRMSMSSWYDIVVPAVQAFGKGNITPINLLALPEIATVLHIDVQLNYHEIVQALLGH